MRAPGLPPIMSLCPVSYRVAISKARCRKTHWSSEYRVAPGSPADTHKGSDKHTRSRSSQHKGACQHQELALKGDIQIPRQPSYFDFILSLDGGNLRGLLLK